MVKIFVGNCSMDSTGDDLIRCFSKYGKVTQADVLEGRGYGFVHMESQDGAKSAVAALDGMELQGRKIRVELSAGKREGGSGPMRSSRGGSRDGGGGGFRDGGRGGFRDRGGDRGGFGRDGGRGSSGYDRDRRDRGGDDRGFRRDYGAGGDYSRSRDAPPYQQSRRPEPSAPYYDRNSAPMRQPPSPPFSRRNGSGGEGVYYERRPFSDDRHGSSRQNDGPIQQIYSGSMNTSGRSGYTGVYEASRASDRDRTQFR